MMPLNHDSGKQDRRFADGSYIRVWLWDFAPIILRERCATKARDAELVIACPRACDQWAAITFGEAVGSGTPRRVGEIEYEGVSTMLYVVGH